MNDLNPHLVALVKRATDHQQMEGIGFAGYRLAAPDRPRVRVILRKGFFYGYVGDGVSFRLDLMDPSEETAISWNGGQGISNFRARQAAVDRAECIVSAAMLALSRKVPA